VPFLVDTWLRRTGRMIIGRRKQNLLYNIHTIATLSSTNKKVTNRLFLPWEDKGE
jgi:hypothetical protein